MSEPSSIPNVKRWRKMIGMTPAAMADVLAYSEDHYRKMERGDRPANEGLELRARQKINAHLKRALNLMRNECVT